MSRNKHTRRGQQDRLDWGQHGLWGVTTAVERNDWGFAAGSYMSQLGDDITTDEATDWTAPDGVPTVPVNDRPDILEFPPERWMRSARCATSSVDMFAYPSASQIRVCQACPVVDDCLNYAVENRIEHGVWGGTTPEQRGHMFSAPRGYVYVVSFGSLLKVGWSRTPDQRVREVGYRNGLTPIWHESAAGTMADERRLHGGLAPWLARGAEWFWCNPQSTRRALALLAELDAAREAA